jgi:hypothetical protein
MAVGDVTIFEEFALNIAGGAYSLVTGSTGDTIKLGIVNNSTIPTATTGTPLWGDFSANDVSPSGNYTANGLTLASQQFLEASGTATFDAADVVISQNASGFTNAFWGIIYDDDIASDPAMAFIELGTSVSEVAGTITITWAGTGIITVDA